METYDVVIVGAGPAGTTAGYLLAGLGLHAAILDKSPFPRRKLCGGLLSNKTLTLLKRVFAEDAATLTDKGIINYASRDYDIFLRDTLLTRGVSPFPFLFVDRSSYDHFLLEKAKSRGATVLEGEKAEEVDPDAGVVSTSSGRKLSGRFIIGADGVNSMVRRALPGRLVNRKAWDFNLSTALETFVPRTLLRKDVVHPIIHFGYVKWGYSWVFPNREKVIIGLGGLNRMNGRTFRKQLHEYLSSLSLLQEGADTADVRITGLPIPTGNEIRRPAFRSILLAGDAAGFSDPISGEGIYYAHRSAEIAAESINRTIRNGASLEETYAGLLNRYVHTEFFHAKILRWIIFTSFALLNTSSLRALTRLGQNCAIDLIHGLRSYRLLRKTGGLLGGL